MVPGAANYKSPPPVFVCDANGGIEFGGGGGLVLLAEGEAAAAECRGVAGGGRGGGAHRRVRTVQQ
eukprot:gene6623-biopygen1120